MSEVVRRLRSFVFNVLVATLDTVTLALMPAGKPRQRILIVRLDSIGDFVLWLDGAKRLVAHYRRLGCEVALAGNQAWAAWARAMELADDVWEIDPRRFRRSFGYRRQWMRRARSAGFSVAIQPTYSRLFLEGDSLVRFTGARDRIGSIGDTSNVPSSLKSWGDRWYTRLVPAAPERTMEIQRNAEFMRAIGFADFQARMPEIPQAAGAPVNRAPHTAYAVLFFAANWEGREWPSDHFIEVGRRLSSRGLQLVLAGAAADRDRADRMATALGPLAVNLAGRTTLAELAELLRGADIVVTNETASVHIGAAVGAPVVCVLGGGHYGRFAPYDLSHEDARPTPVFVFTMMECYGCGWHCVYPRKAGEPVRCIQDVSVEQVWAAVASVLKRPTGARAPLTPRP